MHGRFLLPLKGEEATIPTRSKAASAKYNHAILLEDSVSFYSRQGRKWKVLGIEQGTGPARLLKLSVEPSVPRSKAASTSRPGSTSTERLESGRSAGSSVEIRSRKGRRFMSISPGGRF